MREASVSSPERTGICATRRVHEASRRGAAASGADRGAAASTGARSSTGNEPSGRLQAQSGIEAKDVTVTQAMVRGEPGQGSGTRHEGARPVALSMEGWIVSLEFIRATNERAPEMDRCCASAGRRRVHAMRFIEQLGSASHSRVGGVDSSTRDQEPRRRAGVLGALGHQQRRDAVPPLPLPATRATPCK